MDKWECTCDGKNVSQGGVSMCVQIMCVHMCATVRTRVQACVHVYATCPRHGTESICMYSKRPLHSHPNIRSLAQGRSPHRWEVRCSISQLMI